MEEEGLSNGYQLGPVDGFSVLLATRVNGDTVMVGGRVHPCPKMEVTLFGGVGAPISVVGSSRVR